MSPLPADPVPVVLDAFRHLFTVGLSAGDYTGGNTIPAILEPEDVLAGTVPIVIEPSATNVRPVLSISDTGPAEPLFTGCAGWVTFPLEISVFLDRQIPEAAARITEQNITHILNTPLTALEKASEHVTPPIVHRLIAAAAEARALALASDTPELAFPVLSVSSAEALNFEKSADLAGLPKVTWPLTLSACLMA